MCGLFSFLRHMAATITYALTRVTISGAYKQFLGSGTTMTATFTSGEAPAAGDVGRKILWCRGGTGNSAQWEIRTITAATATTVTVHDPWTVAPSAGDTFRILSTADDILAAQPTAGTKTGTSTFYFNGDLELTSSAGFGSEDQGIEWVKTGGGVQMPIATGCAMEIGRRWGGEGVGSETTNGSRWSYRQLTGGAYQLYTTATVEQAQGPVLNFYGSLIESSIPFSYLFQRMTGPTRFVGCVCDGAIGGRLYSSASEWVDCRMSGNTDTTGAWSLGATLTRAIENVKFFQNGTAVKSFGLFNGTFKGCSFSNTNSTIFRVEGTSGSVYSLIDCTEFADAKISDAGGSTLSQFRSVNFTTTTATGAALAGVAVRVDNAADTTQGAVQVSDASGVCGEILALRRQWIDASPSIVYSAFRIRLRLYGYLWASLNATIADPIKQSFAMIADSSVTLSSAAAAAIAGVTITDHGASPVAWNGKNWGITVTGDLTTNPALTRSAIQHYLHYVLAQNASIGGKASGLHWHNLSPMGDTVTENGTYGATTKGVRVVDQSGNAFPGFTSMQADDGTFYTPPASATLTITNIVAGSRLLVQRTDTSAVLVNAVVSGTSYPYSYTVSGSVPVAIVVRKASGSPTYQEWRTTTTLAGIDGALTANQQLDE
jgi:hypothetical protein